jgi:hypothetical protein
MALPLHSFIPDRLRAAPRCPLSCPLGSAHSTPAARLKTLKQIECFQAISRANIREFSSPRARRVWYISARNTGSADVSDISSGKEFRKIKKFPKAIDFQVS